MNPVQCLNLDQKAQLEWNASIHGEMFFFLNNQQIFFPRANFSVNVDKLESFLISLPKNCSICVDIIW